MAYKTFTAGAVLTASDVNTYLAKQAVIVCTSTTRPSSPPEGMVIYETDTDKLLGYTTATTGWVPPWNLPWGYIGTTSNTSGTNQTGIGSSTTDVSSCSVTWTAVANRVYRISGIVPAYKQTTADGYVTLSITDSSNTAKRQTSNLVESAGSGENRTLSIVHFETGIAAGSQTRKLRITTSAGAGEITAGSTFFPNITVEDVGPNGAPA